jgi:hypothetical protein
MLTDSRTRRASIQGTYAEASMNTAVDYEAQATEFKPTDPDQLRREVKRLQLQGLFPRDIGQALGIHPELAHQIMRGTP